MANIENRVVGMKFDNAAFERGVATTMSTLDKLKEKMNFGNSAKGLSDLGGIGKNVDLTPLSKGVETVTAKFGAMQIAGVTAIATITNKAINAGTQLLKSVTIAPVLDGFHQYEQQINAAQTILGNVAAKGKNLEDVNKTLAKLNDYANLTIYNFSDMATNLGTFTAAGIGLEDSAKAIKGISNVAAAAGAGTQQAAAAMYQLSQGLGRGKINAQDWMSVVSNGMASANFKTAILETAKAMGTIKMPKTMTIDQWTKSGGNFQDAMSKGQITSGVLITTLNAMTGDMTDAQLAAKGFSATQIKSLQAMAKQASAAAQNVKTFSALKDNIQQGVGSAYAQVFKTLIGDIPAATTLFTNLSKILNKLFVDPVMSFNRFLIKLKSLGVISNVAKGIKNIFASMAQVFDSLKDAFRAVFPPSSGKAIQAMSQSFLRFTQHLKLGKDVARDLMLTFKGVFSIFKIAFSIISGLAKVFFSLFSTVGTGGQGALATLLKFTAAVGKVVSAIQAWITKTRAIEKFFSVILAPLRLLTPLVGVISNVARAIASLLTGDISGFTSYINKAFGGLKDIFKTVSDGVKDVAESITKAYDRIVRFGKALVDLVSDRLIGTDLGANLVHGIIEGLKSFAPRAAEAIKELGQKIVDAFKEFFGIHSPSTVFAEFGLNLIQGLANGIVAAASFIKNVFTKFGPILLQGLANGISAAASFIKNAIVVIVTQIATWAASAISAIGSGISSAWDRMGSIFSTIGNVMGTVFSGIGKAIGFVVGHIANFVGSLDSVDAIAIANTGILFLLYRQFKGLKDVFGGVGKNVGGAFSQLTDTLKTMQNAIKVNIIMQIAIAVGVLVGALFILAKIDAKALGVALGALTVLFTEILAMMKVITKIDPQSMVGAGAGMIAIATAVLILAQAIKVLGAMDPKVLGQGAAAIAGIMAALAGMAAVLNGMKGIVAAATGLLILSVAITAIAGAIALYAAIPVDILVQGILSMGAALIALGLAMRAFPKGMVLQAAGIAILAAALVILVPAIIALGLLPIKVLAKGIIAIGAALLLLAVAANAMTGALSGAVAMLAMAGAIAILAPALALLGALPMKVIGKGLLAIAGIMVIFVAAMYLLTPVIAVMALFSSSLLILGLAMLAAGTGFALFVGALGALTVIGAAGFAVLTAGIISLLALLPLMAQQLGYAVITFANVIKLAAPKLAEAAGVCIMAFVNKIAELIPKIAEAGIKMIIGLLTAIRDNIGQVTTLAVEIIVNFITSLAKNIGRIVQAGVNFVISFIEGLAAAIRDPENQKKTGDAGYDLATAIVDGAVRGFTALKDLIPDKLKELFWAAVEGIKDYLGIDSPSKVFTEIGLNIVKGLVNGIKDVPGIVKDAVVDIGEGAIGIAGKVFGLGSPSRVFHGIGKYVVEGLANGISDSSSLVKDATEGIGSDAIHAMKTTLAGISEGLSSNMDSTPTIRPILDLSHVEKNAGKLGSMLTTDPIMSNVAYSSAKDISSRYAANQAASLFDASQTRKALEALAAAKKTETDTPRPVEFHIGTVEDGDSLLRRARATNKMLTLAEGGDSTQVTELV